MGQVTFGPLFWVESMRAGISETIAIGHIIYTSDVPLVLLVKTWIPAKKPVTTSTIMQVDDINIYLGLSKPAQPTFEVITTAEEKSESTLSSEAKKFKIPKKPKPTQPTPVVEEVV